MNKTNKIYDPFNIENIQNIPPTLTYNERWVLWGLKEKANGTFDKVLYQVRKPDQYASSTDPKTWASFSDAVAAFKDSENGRIMGIGYVVTGSPHTGIDVDSCRNRETGTIEPWAMEIIEAMKSYTEITPSGEGVRIFVQGKLPKGIDGVRDKIEIYSEGRYFTVTGQAVEPRRDGKLRQGELHDLYKKYFSRRIEG